METKFYYVYIINSSRSPERYYSGITQDLDGRLDHHNAGAVPSTRPYRPWQYKTYVAFTDESRARDFERYLKTQSGRAFAKKRL